MKDDQFHDKFSNHGIPGALHMGSVACGSGIFHLCFWGAWLPYFYVFLLTIPAASCWASTNQHGETQSGWRFVEPARLLIQYDWRWSLTVDQLLSGTV